MNIAAATLEKRTIAWLCCVLLLVGGWISYQQLGRFEDPEFVIRQAVIVTPYPGALPTEVADEVTDVIEAAVQQLQEIDEITSVSSMGLSRVSVEIDLRFARTRAELEQVWDKLRRKVQDAQRRLPPGAGPSLVNDDFGDVYALFFAVTGDGWSLEQIRDYVEVLERELVLVPGVARVATLGAPRDAIYVEIAGARAAQLGITREQIDAALRGHGTVSAAGDLGVGPQRIRIVPKGGGDSVGAIGNIVLGTGGDRVMFLKDVAEISRGVVEPPTVLVRYDGRPAIGLGVSNVAGGNVVEMGDAVRARLAAMESLRPVGMSLNVVSYQSDSVRAAVDGFVSNLIAAVVIVVGVLVLFMGVRSALVVGLGLLLTVAGTLIAMHLDGIAMQRISLGALIIALGMLVDNAIVVTDGILVRLQRGEDRREAAVAVVRATQWPLLGGTAVGILAFSAIGLSPTDMGEYAGSLFWVILYSMLLSWLLAVTITPLLCVTLLKARPLGEADAARHPVLDRYRALLRLLLRHRLGTGLALLALLAGGIGAFALVPPGFLPESARAQFVVDMYLPQGTDIEVTAAALAKIEDTVRAEPGVTHATSFIGQGGLRFMLTYAPEEPNSAYGQLLVDVDDFRRIDALVARLQAALTEAHPDAAIKVWKFMLGRGGGKKIEAAFSGPDPVVLRRLAEEAKAIMAADPAAVAVQDDWREKVAVLRPQVDPVATERAGVDAAHISAALNRNFSGEQVGVYREGVTLVPIIARAPLGERDDVAALDNVQVYSPTAGRWLPVGQLVKGTNLEWVDATIRRVDRFPTIKAQADPQPGALPGPLLERLKPLVEAIELPPGYKLEWHGEYKSAREANAGLALSAPYGFAAMILAVVVMFNALRQPLVIWLTVPLAVIGVAAGLLLFQAPFEFMAILGFLSLIGMLVKNAIVLVDEADAERAAGKPGLSPVLDAATSRARPVFLGALTTILGVAPLLFDPFFRSMAVTIMFGLAFATLLTLIVVPLLYAVLFRMQEIDG